MEEHFRENGWEDKGLIAAENVSNNRWTYKRNKTRHGASAANAIKDLLSL